MPEQNAFTTQSNGVMKEKNVIMHWFIIGLVVIVVVAGIYFFRQLSHLPDYTISGVPPMTIFQEEVINSPLRNGSSATIVSVLRYWGEKLDLQDVNNAFFPYNRRINYNDFIGYAKKFGYIGKVERLPKPSDLKKYINAEQRTPLIVLNSYDNRNPSVISVSVVIGVSEENKKITLHNWTQGNNYEISFTDFDRLWTSFIPEQNRYWYLVIQPANLSAALAKLPANPKPNPSRLKIMDSLAAIFSDVAASIMAEDPSSKEYYLSRVIADPRFNTELAPWLQVLYRSLLAENQIKAGKLDAAKNNLELAESMNHDLDKPFGEWPAYTTLVKNKGQIHDTYRVRGAYYAATGDQAKAAEFLNKNDQLDLFRHDRPH